MKCIVCDTDSFIVRGKLHGCDIIECRSCRLRWLEPMPSLIDRSRIHDRYINEVWTGELTCHALGKMKGHTFRGYLEVMRAFVRQGKLLDIGCATGDFMKQAEACGFDVYGAEVSSRGAQICSDIFGDERIVKRELQKDDFPPHNFSVITLFDTIEHIPSPATLLSVIHEMLEDNGYLVLVTPDTASLSSRVLGGHWLHYKQEHLYYYSRRNIAKLLSPLFQVKKVIGASKTISLGYAGAAIGNNTGSVPRNMLGAFLRSLPSGIKKKNMRVPFGEMLVIAQKVKAGTV